MGRQATFRFGIERATLASLTLYDVSGRAVRVLVREELTPGEYARSWDGRNDLGTRVASGVYIAKFVAGERIITQKVVMGR